MTRRLFITLAALTLPLALQAADSIVLVEEAAEVSRLELQPGSGDGTRIYARICDHCEMLSLRIGQGTSVFRRKTPITLTQATQLRGVGATVLFDPQTRDITRIIFWR